MASPRDGVRGGPRLYGRRADLGVGTGRAPGHHGEILQGLFRDMDGRAVPGLVTVPLMCSGARAVFEPVPASTPGEAVRVWPRGRVRAAAAAESLLLHLHRVHGLPCLSGRLTIDARLPIGAGLGSSSADVHATLRAVLDAVHASAQDATLCRLAVSVEGASDPLAYMPRVVLFAQRLGHVIESLGPRLPALRVLSCRVAGEPVDTLRCAIPRDEDLPVYEELRARLRQAVERQDARGIGEVATMSAELNQVRLPRAQLPVLRAVAEAHGAVGVQVAHSGCVAGVMFDATDGDVTARVSSAARDLRRRGVELRGSFDVG